jgi:hypothetical protein
MSDSQKCPACKGRGHSDIIECSQCQGLDAFVCDVARPDCPKCGGTGWQKCRKCQGTGQAPVTVEAGSQS